MNMKLLKSLFVPIVASLFMAGHAFASTSKSSKSSYDDDYYTSKSSKSSYDDDYYTSKSSKSSSSYSSKSSKSSSSKSSKSYSRRLRG